jgi:hypothetical protein
VPLSKRQKHEIHCTALHFLTSLKLLSDMNGISRLCYVTQLDSGSDIPSVPVLLPTTSWVSTAFDLLRVIRLPASECKDPLLSPHMPVYYISPSGAKFWNAGMS